MLCTYYNSNYCYIEILGIYKVLKKLDSILKMETENGYSSGCIIKRSKLTKYISGVSFPCNRSEFIMPPSIYPIIIPGMFHHLRKEKL